MPSESGFSKIVESVEKYSPFLARQMITQYLNNASPFNGHLKGKLDIWMEGKCQITVKRRRSVKNHLGSVHAGALFTLGETCAGLLLMKNFSPQKFRLIIKSASVEYSKQARMDCIGTAELTEAKIRTIKLKTTAQKPAAPSAVKSKVKPKAEPLAESEAESEAEIEAFFIPMETVIKNPLGEVLCVVKTEWQIKPWDQVRR